MKIAIATSMYRQEPRFVSDYMAGIADAVRGRDDVMLIAAVEHDFDAARAMTVLPENVSRTVRAADGPATPAAMRRLMVKAAGESDADIVVFTDFDDRLTPQALKLHEDTLADSDISYGDLDVIDANGQETVRRFFDGADVPYIAGISDLRTRNFIGFGSSAVRRSVLVGGALSIPDNVVAADWWFFSVLLADGHTARRAGGSVAKYRNHANSILGGNAAMSVADLRRRAEIVFSHYRQLPDAIRPADELTKVSGLIAWIDRKPDEAAGLAQRAGKRGGVWFDDVAFAAGRVAQVQRSIS